jgi:phage/plasmid-associated DNA primase
VKHLLEAWGKADKWTSHKASEVTEYIRVDTPELWERPPTDEVNVANGILGVRTGELRPHDPSYLSCTDPGIV